MSKIKNESRVMSLYDFFTFCKKNDVSKRGLGIITSKQNLFFGDLEEWFQAHFMIANEIEKVLFPNMPEFDVLCGIREHAYMFAEGKSLLIALPESLELSLSQVDFIDDLLDDVARFNKEVSSKDKVLVTLIMRYNKGLLSTQDVSEIKDELNGFITRDITVREEEIVGKVLDEDRLFDMVSYHLKGSDDEKRKAFCDDSFFGEVAEKVLNKGKKKKKKK